MKPLVAVLFVDALGASLMRRHDTFDASLPHRRPLETVLGFSSGALPTAFTGRSAREHGRWLMYQRALGPTPFAGFRHLRWLPPRVRRSERLSRWLTSVVQRRGVRGYFHLYEVPRAELEWFDLPERDDLFSPGGLPVDSLWDSLERRRLRWRGWNWRTREADALQAMCEAAADPSYQFLFAYTAELDARLHHEGTGGAGVLAQLQSYERWCARMLEIGRSTKRPLWLYVASDHGMVDVREHVDVMSVVDRLPWKRGRDYHAFYDSTFARFWWASAGARGEIREALQRDARGRWLGADDLERASAAFPDARYGDDLYLLRPGALLLPSYMGHAPLAAMHGYDPAHPDMAGMLASNRPLPAGVTHLRHLRAFLESELDDATAVAA